MKRTILAPGHELLSYRIHEVTPYINWIYFFHAWGFQPRFAAIANIHGCDSCRALWLTTFPEEERTKASEAMQLFKEANRMLGRLDETISIHCIFRLCQANADGDNLLIEGTTFPLLRQQTPQPDGGPFLCLSDFVRPLSSGTPDIVGLFASTISEEAEETYKSDPYKHLLVQTLNDRLAEASRTPPQKRCTNMSARRLGGMPPTNPCPFRICWSRNTKASAPLWDTPPYPTNP